MACRVCVGEAMVLCTVCPQMVLRACSLQYGSVLRGGSLSLPQQLLNVVVVDEVSDCGLEPLVAHVHAHALQPLQLAVL